MNLVYTAIYGGYDKLLQPTQVTDGWATVKEAKYVHKNF